MKKSDLRRLLKPLVKECVRETLLEEGLLSTIVSEVVRGVSPVLVEAQTSQQRPDNKNSKQQTMVEQQRRELQEDKNRRLKEQKIKILNATGFSSQIFEGVEPLSKGGTPNDSPQQGPLGDMDAKDPGVDISGIMAASGHKWNKLI